MACIVEQQLLVFSGVGQATRRASGTGMGGSHPFAFLIAQRSGNLTILWFQFISKTNTQPAELGNEIIVSIPQCNFIPCPCDLPAFSKEKATKVQDLLSEEEKMYFAIAHFLVQR